MNRFIKGNWYTISRHLRNRFSSLSYEDVNFGEGQENQLISRLQAKLGKSQDEILDILNEVSSKTF
ncbi:MAG: general stress protein CsbD [Cytophagales bacterium]|nr:general stress protein CsbD [Cytophagales bacterium]MDW8383183.1 general stress protein CsbD [Flammeovirgaceae bacterium]